jgi:hypothetical protein
MSKEDRGTFTLSDIRAIRWLVLVMGGIATGMMLVTDRDSPVMVAGFITVVTIVPLVAIYLLRRFAKKKERDQSPEPTTGTAMPAAVQEVRRP